MLNPLETLKSLIFYSWVIGDECVVHGILSGIEWVVV
jgi:hypothetical protein